MEFYPSQFYTILLILCGVANLLIGFFVALKASRRSIKILFSALSFCLSLWCLSISLVSSNLSLFWGAKGTVLAGIPIPIILLLFSYAFPEGKIPFSKFILFILLLPSILLISFMPTRLVVDPMISPEGTLILRLGALHYVFALQYLVFFTWSGWNIIKKYLGSDARNKQKYIYFFTGIIISSLIGVFSNVIMVSFFHINRLVYFGPLGTIFLSGLTSYAIVKQRLMDIKVVISKAAARTICYLFYGGLYVAFISFYVTYYDKRMDLPFVIFSLAYGVFAIESFEKTRIAVQTSADKLFLRGRYDYYKALDEVSSKLINCVSYEELFNIANMAFIDIHEVSAPRIFLPEGASKEKAACRAYDLLKKEFTDEMINKDSALCKYFSLEKRVVDKIQKNPPEVEKALKELNAELIAPCIFRRKLMGLIVLGPKLTQEIYTNEDIRLIKNIADQTAAALERIQAYEDLKEEVSKARAQLEISSRMASLGTLAAGMTHEIRNPLAIIQSKLELLPQKMNDKKYVKSVIEVIPRHIERITEMLNRMLSFARPSAKKIQTIKLARVLDDVVDLIDGEANRRRVKIKREYEGDLLIEGDRNELSQVFLNLALNALQVMPNGGDLSFVAGESEDGVEVRIKDSGPGITQENIEKVFDPFYTERPSGTGLGLSISRKIVEEHKGSIAVESEKGKGATFIVRLPAVHQY